MRTLTNIVSVVCFFASSMTTLAQKPDFSGNWVLNERLSQDPFDKIDLALGAEQRRGTSPGTYDAVSSGIFLRDADRASTLRALVDYARVLEVVEIEQSDEELEIWVGAGDEFFSLFYLDGESHARELQDGLRLEATAEWRGDSIHVTQVGENDARLQQIYTLQGADRLAFVFQLESTLSETPVQFRVVYDRAAQD